MTPQPVASFSMLNMLLSVGAYVGVVTVLGLAVVMMARRERFEQHVRDDDR